MPARVAALSLVLAIIALALGIRGTLFPGSSDCQSVAWNGLPAAAELPTGWSIAASDFTVAGVTSTLSGPTRSGGSAASSIYTTVSCFSQDASGAVSRSRAAASAAGQTVRSLSSIGDEGYSTGDPAGGGIAIHFRRGNLVGYAATDGTASQTDLQAIATAFDAAMQRAEAGGTPLPAAARTAGTGVPGTSSGAAVGGSPAPSPPVGSAPVGSAPGASAPGASASAPAAPELEALLPATVGGVTLTRDSALGADVLNAGSSGRALAATLRTLGATPDQLHIAEAFDPSGSINLSMLAFGITGLDTGKLRTAILDAWLSANGPGVKTSTATISGHAVTKVDYGDKGSISYVLVDRNAVVVIETTDEAIATEAAAALR